MSRRWVKLPDAPGGHALPVTDAEVLREGARLIRARGQELAKVAPWVNTAEYEKQANVLERLAEELG